VTALADGAQLKVGTLSRLTRGLRSEISCEEVAAELPAILDRGATASARLVDHVERCLACQAELARYRKLLRLLTQMRTSEVDVPPGVVSDVLRALEGAASRRAIRSLLSGRPARYGTAVGAAVFAGAGLVLLARGRRLRAPRGEP
jgi:DNA-binding transcriptional regulator YdaS (Cro superfamily)